MKDELHKELVARIDKLRDHVRDRSSSAIVGTVGALLRPDLRPADAALNLQAPARQCFFLLQVAFQTAEPRTPKQFEEPDVRAVVKQLNEIFRVYARMYFPERDEVDHLPKSWHENRTVIMPYFLTYFTQPPLASVEQIIRRIEAYLGPFSNIIEARLGLGAKDLLTCGAQLSKLLQANMDRALERMQELKGIWEIWRTKPQRKVPPEAIKAGQELFDAVDGFFVLPMDQFERLVGADKAGGFVEMLLTKRGAEDQFVYPTARYSVEERPLFLDENRRIYCPSVNALYLAILTKGEATIELSDAKADYLVHRDKRLEEETESQFRRIVSPGALFMRSACETPDLQFEHDLIILSGRTLFIIEAKASPPREPFRDPDKAIVRVRDHFRSDAGPQKAFAQANGLRSKIFSGQVVPLYNKHGVLAELSQQNVDEIFCICVTRDTYGPLAASLDLLLEKEETESYPWVIDIYSLESLFDAFQHFGLHESDFNRYLSERTQLHGKIFGTDELEFAGFFLRHDSMRELIESEASFIQLAPDYSDVFDSVYEANARGEKIERVVVPANLGRTNERSKEAVVKRRGDAKRKRVKKSRDRMAKQSRRRNRRHR